jgi:hypothetical protein
MVLDLEVIKVMSRKMKFLGQGTQPRITYMSLDRAQKVDVEHVWNRD